MSEWQVVARRRKGARQEVPAANVLELPDAFNSALTLRSTPYLKSNTTLQLDESTLQSYSSEVQAALAPLIQKLQKSYATLLASEFLRRFERTLDYIEAQELFQLPEQQAHNTFNMRHAHHLMVYGLSSPAKAITRGLKGMWSQLALACWLRTKLPKMIGPSTAVDPDFTLLDKQLLKAVYFEVAEHGKSHAVEEPTLFFMPHCPRLVYNDVLKDNWSPQQLQQIAILGNSFHGYAQLVELRQQSGKEERPHHLLEVTSSNTAWELAISEAAYPVPSAFNIMSLHLFPEWKVKAACVTCS